MCIYIYTRVTYSRVYIHICLYTTTPLEISYGVGDASQKQAKQAQFGLAVKYRISVT